MSSLHIHIKNLTSNIIGIHLTHPQDANLPTNYTIQLQPNERKNITVIEGTMNLFIFDGANVIWKGIIPTSVQGDLTYNGKEVKYNSLVIPEGFNPITTLNDDRIHVNTNTNTKFWIGLLVFLVVILIIYLKYYS